MSSSDYKSLIAFAGLIVFLFLICVTAIRWHDIKGIVFINQELLQKTAGNIVSSKVEQRSSKYGCGYHFAINYEYDVDGKIYNSNAVTFAHTSAVSFAHYGTSDGRMATEYVQKYPVGKDVTVFYTAADPSFSVLEPETKDASLIVVVIGLIVVPIILGWAMIGLIKENMYLG